MKNLLLIGSEGFIGKHLRKCFEDSNYNVICCDVISIQRGNYFQLVNTYSDLRMVLEQNKFEFCINSAGSANVQFSYSNHFNDFSLNTQLVFTILSAIKDSSNNCKFINFSSAAIYGNPISLPINESQQAIPLSPYGWHKLYSEQICKEFFIFFKVPTISLRVFSAYGPGLRKQLFWDLYQKANQSNSIELFGTGQESRDFIYIDDIVNAVECVINRAEFNGECINVAAGIEAPISEVANMFLGYFNDKKTLKFNGEVKVGDPMNWKADISKLKELGFEQKTSLSQGIENYYNWILKNQEHGS